MCPSCNNPYLLYRSEKRHNHTCAFYAGDYWHHGPRQDIIRFIDSCIKTVIRMPAENVEKLRGKNNLPPSGLKGNNALKLTDEY